MRKSFWILAVTTSVGILAAGCVSRSQEKLLERNAFLEGQNSVLQQQQAQLSAQNAQNAEIVQNAAQTSAEGAAQNAGILVVGKVQNSQVSWTAGMTLAQAVAAANYVGTEQPTQIIITRNGESATMDASALLNGKDVPLQPGDVIEVR